MGKLEAPLETPESSPKVRLALLLTRCRCQQLIQVPEPGPHTVTVDLVPLKGQPEPEKRIFYKAGETVTPEGEKVLVYQEGPALDKPRILIPGMIPPKNLMRKVA